MENSTGQEVEEKKQKGVASDLPIKGSFARYDSPFLKLMLSLLGTRYVWLAIEDINPRNFLKKPDPALRSDFKPWTKTGPLGYLSRNFAALGMGTTIMGALAYYSERTYKDIHTLYAESIGYELGKNAKDVTWKDIFFKSRNKALNVTCKAFLKRTLTRVAAVATFFVPWQIFRDYTKAPPKYDANANAGVGAVATYLSIYEGFVRKPSYFDIEQNLMSRAASHAETNVHEAIKSSDIRSLLLLHKKNINKKYVYPTPNSLEGRNNAILSDRIADLMNQTYNNAVKQEHATLTVGKFNYLVGFGMLESFPESLAFVELANNSGDMKNVNAAAAALKKGEDPKVVFKAYGIDMEELVNKSPYVTNPESASTRFTDVVEPQKTRIPPVPRTHQDFAAPATSSPTPRL